MQWTINKSNKSGLFNLSLHNVNISISKLLSHEMQLHSTIGIWLMVLACVKIIKYINQYLNDLYKLSIIKTFHPRST